MIFKRKNEILFLIFLFCFYIFLVKELRPYLYQSFPNYKILNFLLGVLPNFIGVIMMYIVFDFIPNLSKKVSVFFILGLIFFMETERFINQNKAFDVCDIITSIIGITFIHFFYKKIKKNIYPLD